MIAAVDIGGTKIAVGMVDGDGKVLARQECPTNPDGGYANALRNITELLRATARTAHTEISGIGIGSTGPVVSSDGRPSAMSTFFPTGKERIRSKISAKYFK